MKAKTGKIRADILTTKPDKAYVEHVEWRDYFHPEALEEGVKTPTNLGPFVLPAEAETCRAPDDNNDSSHTLFQ
jgi:hypothetical protein